MIGTWRSATVTLQPRAGRDKGEIPASPTGESWVMLEAQSREPSGVGGGTKDKTNPRQKSPKELVIDSEVTD